MDFSNPILMSMMDSREGGDIWKMMMMMQALGGNNGTGGAPEINNQRLQMMMLAPMGKKFITNLAKKLVAMSDEKRMRVIAALVAGELGRKQSDEFGQILENGSMSMLMQLVGMPSIGGMMMGGNNTLGREPVGNDEDQGVGGEVLGRRVVREPYDEAMEIIPAKSSKKKLDESDENFLSPMGSTFE